MKRFLILVLTAAMLLCAVPTAIAGEESAAFVADTRAPASFCGDLVVVDEPVSVAEVLSYFKNGAQITALDAGDTPLALADDAIPGTKLVSGEESRTVVLRGDVNVDGKINVRDIVNAMGIIVSADTATAAADVNADSAVNARDVISLMRHLVGYDEFFGEAGVLSQKGDAQISVYFDSLMHRVSKRDVTVYSKPCGVYHMAKSETEDALLNIVSEKQLAGVTVNIGALENDGGEALDVTVRTGYYYDYPVYKKIMTGLRFQSPLEDGPHAEALPKLLSPLDLQENESHGVVFQVMTDADTASGWYSAPVTLTTADGTTVKEATLRFYVWNFVLDEKPATESAFGFDFGTAYKMAAKEESKKTGEDIYAVMNDRDFMNENMPRINEEYMQIFLDSRISPYHLPYDVTDPRCDELMSNPRITSFCIDGGGNYHQALKTAIAKGEWITSDDSLLRAYRKLAQDPEWLHKAYVYYVDEPSTLNVYLAREVREHMDALFDSTEDLKGIEWHQVVPMGGNDFFTDEFGNETDECDYVFRYVDIMIPQTYAFGRYYSNAERMEAKKKGIELFPNGAMINRWTSKEVFDLYGKQWQERYDEYADEQGLRRWWYICCSPEMPYPNFFTFYQGAAQRLVLWQQYMFHSEGLLYWATQDKWDNTNLKRFPTNGDGVLLLWGEMFGQTGPVPSVRWEYIRDGIEDFQYFSQLERTGVDREEIVSKYINRVTKSILEYEEDPYIYENVRVEVGYELERQSNVD